MNSEFSEAWAANEYLALYRKIGIEVIKSIPLHHIKRYDVWQCVFSKRK